MSQGIEVGQHLARAARHRRVADALAEAGDEWAAVCYFYGAYHLVRYALRTDPVFDDPTSLSRIRPDLVPELRDVERHRGRRGGTPREYGINDLMMLLYRGHAEPYVRLHQASIGVRYGSGLIGKPIDRVRAEFQRIEQAHDNGDLRYAPAASRPA